MSLELVDDPTSLLDDNPDLGDDRVMPVRKQLDIMRFRLG